MQNVLTTRERIEQTLAQNVLAAHKRRYSAMMAEQKKEGIAVLDLDGRIRYVDETWAGMHGYKIKDKLIGKHFNLFHIKEQMRTDVTALLKEAKQCGRSEKTIEHIKSDGTVLSLRTKVSLMKDKACKAAGFIVFTADIDQYTKLQERTAENLKRVKQLSEQIARYQKLFGEYLKAGQYSAKLTGDFQANNDKILEEKLIELYQLQRRPEQYPKQILHNQTQVITTNQRPEQTNPEHRRYNSTPSKSPEKMLQTKNLSKLLNTKELAEVAELAKRLS
jgi:PAS domain S-box-containing protein